MRIIHFIIAVIVAYLLFYFVFRIALHDEIVTAVNDYLNTHDIAPNLIPIND